MKYDLMKYIKLCVLLLMSSPAQVYAGSWFGLAFMTPMPILMRTEAERDFNNCSHNFSRNHACLKPESTQEYHPSKLSSAHVDLKSEDNEKMYKKTEYRTKETIEFGSASDVIQPASYDLLREYGSAMENGVSDSVILVEGHADSIGTEKENYDLSYKRATSVKKFLTSFYEISPERILVKAYGEKKPLVSNMLEKGRSVNRRVEFVRLQEVEFAEKE